MRRQISMSFLKPAWTLLTRSLSDADQFADSRLRNLPYPVVTLFIALLHVGSSWLGYLLISGGAQVTPVFPEAGLDFVAILVFGPRYWPVLLASYFATSLWRHVLWAPSVGVALVSLLRTIGAARLYRWISERKFLGNFIDLIGIAAAGTIAPGFAAGLGTLCLILGGRFPASQWGTVLSRWWIADALGTLTVAPILITLARHWASGPQTRDMLYVLKVLLYVCGVSSVSYVILFHQGASFLLFGVLVLILVGAAWLGSTAARVSALAVAVAAIWATHIGVGSFVGGTPWEDLQNLDLFLAAISLTGMAVGAFRLMGNLVLPGGLLLAGWAMSGWLYASLEHNRATYDDSRFDRIITVIETGISDRFKTYEEVLWGAAGHLAASQRIDPKDWHIYVSRLHLLELYPGTTAVSIVQPVPDEQLERFVQARRREHWPEFAAHPINGTVEAPETSLEHLLVVCAEPAEVAASAIGADLVTDPRRRLAAERARDLGTAVLTSSTALGDGSGKGLQLFVPVYREGATLTTTEDRRKGLVAWVSIVFSANTFLRSVLGGTQKILSLQVYDGGRATPDDLFFSSVRSPGDLGLNERITHLTLGGNTWTFGWRRLSRFPYLSRTPSTWTAGCTALLTLLLAGLVMTLQAGKRQATERLKFIQSALTLGTWELDVTNGDVQCSEQFLRLNGIHEARNRLSMAEWLSYVHPEDRDAMLADIRAPRGNCEPIDRQYRVVWPDGSTHWVHRKALAIGTDHVPIWVVGVDFDMTEMKQLQSQLTQAQKLESVGQLAAGIAHEINTPIQYVGDNGKFLEDAFRDLMKFADAGARSTAEANNAGLATLPAVTREQLDDSVLEYLRDEVPRALAQLLEGVDQVARIVRAMKEFSHPGPVEKIPVDLNRAIESTILVSKNEWKYVAEVITDYDADLPPVPCVAGEFNQVILNLIVNAAHAIAEVVKDSGRQGQIRITTRQAGAAAEIRISDTGGGIPPAIQSKVFDPFFTTKPVGQGTGQGLAIAHSVIVQKQGGSIQFESEPGCGTTFVIQLPLAHELEAV